MHINLYCTTVLKYFPFLQLQISTLLHFTEIFCFPLTLYFTPALVYSQFQKKPKKISKKCSFSYEEYTNYLSLNCLLIKT